MQKKVSSKQFQCKGTKGDSAASNVRHVNVLFELDQEEAHCLCSMRFLDRGVFTWRIASSHTKLETCTACQSSLPQAFLSGSLVCFNKRPQQHHRHFRTQAGLEAQPCLTQMKMEPT